MPSARYFLSTAKESIQRKPSLQEALMYFSVFTSVNHPHLPVPFPHHTSRSTRRPLPPTPHTNCTTAHTTSESYLSFKTFTFAVCRLPFAVCRLPFHPLLNLFHFITPVHPNIITWGLFLKLGEVDEFEIGEHGFSNLAGVIE